MRSETTNKYWDCECAENYIHPKSEKVCHKCKAHEEDCPDALVVEVMKFGLPLEPECA